MNFCIFKIKNIETCPLYLHRLHLFYPGTLTKHYIRNPKGLGVKLIQKIF